MIFAVYTGETAQAIGPISWAKHSAEGILPAGTEGTVEAILEEDTETGKPKVVRVRFDIRRIGTTFDAICECGVDVTLVPPDD